MKALLKEYIKISRLKCAEKYICCMKAGLQEILTYRFQYCVGLFLMLIPFAIKNCIWLFAFKNNKQIAEYTFDEILLYNCLILILGNLMSLDVHWEISNEIKTGDLSKYLAKPIEHRKYWFSKWMGNKIGQLPHIFFVLGIIYIIYPEIFNQMRIRETVIGFIVFGFACIMNFLIFYSLSLLSFRFLEISSFFVAFDLVLRFINGEYLPLDFMPETWISILRVLPADTGIYFAVQVMMGNYSQIEILNKIFIQLIWIFIFSICSSRSWKKGIKRYESIG